MCTAQLMEIHQALQSYKAKNGNYPASLQELVPNYLKDSRKLHCPGDQVSRPVSYGYRKPAANDPATTIVCSCNNHVMQGRAIPLNLQKDGQLQSGNGGSSSNYRYNNNPQNAPTGHN
jgi:hypothetical protein